MSDSAPPSAQSLPLPPTPEVPASAPSSPSQFSLQTMDRLWGVATNPLLLLCCAMALLLLFLFSLWLPQLPGELRTETAAAQRWLAATSVSYGGASQFLLGLGLFDVLHGVFFRLLLGGIGFLLLLQLAQATLVAVRLRRAPAALSRTGTVNGEPLPVASSRRLQRWRRSHPEAPLALANQLQQLMEARFGRAERRTTRVMVAAGGVGSSPGGEPAAPVLGEQVVLEERLFGVRGLQRVLLRPFLAAGLGLALLLIWLNATFGWDYTPPLLTPGARTAEIVRGVQLEYVLEEPRPGVIAPALRVRVGETLASLPVAGPLREQVGQAELWAQPAAPGLVVQALAADVQLALPGQASTTARLGLAFLSPGSEQAVLLPAQGMGLRMVRVGRGTPAPADDTLLVEVFRNDQEEPVDRFEVTESTIVAVPTGDGSATQLAFVPLPALAVHMRYSPGSWLLWLALACVLVGAPGYWGRAGFLLAQIGPWPEHRSVLMVQSSLPGELAAVRRWHGELTAAPDERERQP